MGPELTSVVRCNNKTEIESFVSRLAREYFMDGPDRRVEPRLRVTLPVNLQPLDDDLNPLGYRSRAVTRDISASGIGLVCQDPVNASYLMLSLPTPAGESLEVVAKVLRCRPVGYYFDVGCQFAVDQ